MTGPNSGSEPINLREPSATSEKPDEIVLWTVYDNPRNYPGLFVACKWLGLTPTNEVITAPTLAALRDKLPRGLFCVSRDVKDDPCIVEIWI